MEEIEHGTPERGQSRLVVGAVIILAFVLALGWWVDRRWQDSTTDDVSAVAERASTALDNAQRRLTSMRDYVRPAIARPDLDPVTRDSMDDLVAQARDQGLVELASVRAELVAFTFVPWHSGPRDVRDAALSALDQGIAELSADAGPRES